MKWPAVQVNPSLNNSLWFSKTLMFGFCFDVDITYSLVTPNLEDVIIELDDKYLNFCLLVLNSSYSL